VFNINGQACVFDTGPSCPVAPLPAWPPECTVHKDFLHVCSTHLFVCG